MTLTKEQIDEARKNPKFIYVKLSDCWDKHTKNDGGFAIDWAVENLGFGQFTFIKNDKKVICDNETMGRDFVEKVLKYFIYNVEMKY